MAKSNPTTIYNIKADTSAGKGCALIDTAKNALLRIGDLAKRGDDNLKRNFGILGLALDGIADEMKDLKFANDSYKERLKSCEAEIAALKEANPSRMERVLKSANGIVDKIAENVANRVNKHLNVRSKTENEATEMTKGYDLFAKVAAPTVFRAYLDNDRILTVETAPSTMTPSEQFNDTIIALAERARIMDYGGNVIETIYEKEAK